MKIFNTVQDLKEARLTAGQLTETKGYHSVGDGGQARYLIQTSAEFGDTPDEYGNHTLANGNVAVLQVEGAVNVKQFGAKCDGVADEKSAFEAAFNNTAFTNFFIPNGQYKLTGDSATITRGNINITASPKAEFILGTSGNSALYFNGPGIDITGSISSINGSTIIAPSHGLSEMDYIKIVSDDYFSGLTGVPGYGVRNKVEVVQVNQIIDSNTIRIVGMSTLFDYSPSANLTFSRINFIENVSFTGGKIVGTGGFSGDRLYANIGISLNYVLNSTLDNIDSYNCTDQIIRITNSMFVNVTNCNFNGPDRALPDNSNNPSNRWTKGVEVHSGNNINVQNCRGWNLRRIMDIETFFTDGIVSNNCSQINCKVFYSSNGIVSHIGYNFTAIGNYAECNAGVALRTVNNTIIGNTIVLLSQNDPNGIRVGRDVELSSDTQEDAYNGNSIIKNNSIIGNVGTAFRFYGASDNIIIEGNTITGEAQECFYMTGKRAKSVSIENNTIPIRTGGESIIGVQNGLHGNAPKLYEFGSLLVNNNNFKGSGTIPRFITLLGTFIGKGAGDIIATNNILGEIDSYLITRYVSPAGYSRYGTTQFTAGETILKNNTIDKLNTARDAVCQFINWSGSRNESLKPITSDNICKNWGGSGVVVDHVPTDEGNLNNRFSSSNGFVGGYTYTKGQIFWFSDPTEESPKGFLVTKSGTSVYTILNDIIINASGTVGSDIISCDAYSPLRALNNYVSISGETYRVVEVLNVDRTSLRLDRPLHTSISGTTINNSPATYVLL